MKPLTFSSHARPPCNICIATKVSCDRRKPSCTACKAAGFEQVCSMADADVYKSKNQGGLNSLEERIRDMLKMLSRFYTPVLATNFAADLLAFRSNTVNEIPECRGCQDNETHCDSHLPCCKACEKKDIECEYYDKVRLSDTCCSR